MCAECQRLLALWLAAIDAYADYYRANGEDFTDGLMRLRRERDAARLALAAHEAGCEARR